MKKFYNHLFGRGIVLDANTGKQIQDVARPRSGVAMLAFVCLALLALSLMAPAAMAAGYDTNFASASALMSGVSDVFNPALAWVIGATAVLLAIGWVKKAARR